MKFKSLFGIINKYLMENMQESTRGVYSYGGIVINSFRPSKDMEQGEEVIKLNIWINLIDENRSSYDTQVYIELEEGLVNSYVRYVHIPKFNITFGEKSSK